MMCHNTIEDPERGEAESKDEIVQAHKGADNQMVTKFEDINVEKSGNGFVIDFRVDHSDAVIRIYGGPYKIFPPHEDYWGIQLYKPHTEHITVLWGICSDWIGLRREEVKLPSKVSITIQVRPIHDCCDQFDTGSRSGILADSIEEVTEIIADRLHEISPILYPKGSAKAAARSIAIRIQRKPW